MSKKKISTEALIERFRNVFGGEYDYSKVEFVDWNTKICIVCPIHGDFWTLPSNHLHRSGCPMCKGRKVRERNSLTQDEFVERSRKLHNDKYDYSKVNYVNNATKVCIICPIHGEFWQRPMKHLKGNGCIYCRNEMVGIRHGFTTEQFIRRAEKIHGKGTFDYSLVEYVNTHVPVKIKCQKGHVFEQKPCDHIHGSRCPICHESRGERYIVEYLERNDIEFQREYKIWPQQVLFGRKYFRADFYLPKRNTIIEFHGEQHYRAVPMWDNSAEKLEAQQDRDKRLRDYCKQNSITLIEIPFNKLNSINRILSHRLK